MKHYLFTLHQRTINVNVNYWNVMEKYFQRSSADKKWFEGLWIPDLDKITGKRGKTTQMRLTSLLKMNEKQLHSAKQFYFTLNSPYTLAIETTTNPVYWHLDIHESAITESGSEKHIQNIITRRTLKHYNRAKQRQVEPINLVLGFKLPCAATQNNSVYSTSRELVESRNGKGEGLTNSSVKVHVSPRVETVNLVLKESFCLYL